MEKLNFFFLFLFIYQIYECELINSNNEMIFNKSPINPEIFKEVNDDYQLINLNEELDREGYEISKSAYKFINNNANLTYVFESNSSNLIIQNEQSQGLQTLNILKYNSFLTVNKTGDNSETIKITSIPNSNVNFELLFENNYDEFYLKQKFTNIKIIETNENNLIANFDSFDDNHEIFYAKYIENDLSPKDFYPINKSNFTKINFEDKLIQLEKNSTYIIINDVKDFYFSSLELFITQQENNNTAINLKGNNDKYLYLNKEKNYSITWNSIDSNLRIIKLSKKTKNSKITINNNILLNKDNMYYELPKDIKIELKVENEDALIEFLYYFEDEKIFDKLEIYKEKLDSNLTHKILIKLDSPDDYVIKLESDLNKSFGTSIYGKASTGNYHYYSSACHDNLIYGFSFEESIKKDKFREVKTGNGEYYSLYLFLETTNIDQPIYLTYYPKNLNISLLNSANYTYFEIKPDVTYKFIVEDDDSYTFKMGIKDKDIQSYSPLFTFQNKTNFNEIKLVMKNEGNDKNTPVYINYYQNWKNDKDILMTIIADRAKKILLVIYIIASILIVVFFALVVLILIKMLKNQDENVENSSNELITKEY